MGREVHSALLMNSPLIGILAGGRSTRMGTDKALLEVEGESILERTVRTALTTGCPVAVSGRVSPDTWLYSEVLFIPDMNPYEGPLHGIARLLERFNRPMVAIGCDMPLLTGEALNWLITLAGEDFLVDGLATEDSQGRIQPLFSVYTPRVLPLIESLSIESSCPVLQVIITGEFEVVQLPPGLEEVIQSADTPYEIAQMRNLLTHQEAGSRAEVR